MLSYKNQKVKEKNMFEIKCAGNCWVLIDKEQYDAVVWRERGLDKMPGGPRKNVISKYIKTLRLTFEWRCKSNSEPTSNEEIIEWANKNGYPWVTAVKDTCIRGKTLTFLLT